MDSEWLKKVKEKPRDPTKQENVIITAKELKQAIARMSNWKAAGPDHVQGVWFKKVATSLHPELKQHLQECVNAGAVPWLTEGRTVLIMKDKSKGTEITDHLLAFH